MMLETFVMQETYYDGWICENAIVCQMKWSISYGGACKLEKGRGDMIHTEAREKEREELRRRDDEAMRM